MALTKAELLQGRDNKKPVHIEALDGEIEIRPLTDGEFYEIQALFMQAVEMNIGLTKEDLEGKSRLDGAKLAEKMNTTVDVGQFAEANHQSDVLAAVYGLSVGETSWTAEEVDSLPPGSAQEIAEAVYDFSGAHPDQEVMLRHFRGNGSGARDSADSDDGSTAGDGT
ncbi:hypothetical protein LCGC14_2677650, partial [marine sediment metagenome]